MWNNVPLKRAEISIPLVCRVVSPIFCVPSTSARLNYWNASVNARLSFDNVSPIDVLSHGGSIRAFHVGVWGRWCRLTIPLENSREISGSPFPPLAPGLRRIPDGWITSLSGDRRGRGGSSLRNYSRRRDMCGLSARAFVHQRRRFKSDTMGL